MKGDEFKTILEDINDKFDTLIEGQNLLNEKIDRHITLPHHRGMVGGLLRLTRRVKKAI